MSEGVDGESEDSHADEVEVAEEVSEGHRPMGVEVQEKEQHGY